MIDPDNLPTPVKIVLGVIGVLTIFYFLLPDSFKE